ncbi:MAG: glutamate formimidoyltransferase [Chloroflexi bacterium]|nr:glutamate formimidoyltransferase [Chloroflexota bacterium]
MGALVECVANFSEGRRGAVIDSIVSAIDRTDGVAVLGAESDADHNRAVVTFAGAPDCIGEAAFKGIQRAGELIDLERHRGQHPRIGAADVIPFVPLRDVSMADCVVLARKLGQRVGETLSLPVFLYERAALQEANRNLADIRRGGYEKLKASLAAGKPPKPDFGPCRLKSAGGCIIGARNLLIAYNVFLDTTDVAIAREIARAIRESSGGLPHVKALGLFVKGRAQVSMNLTNYKVTSMRRAVEATRAEASRLGVNMVSSEIIGLLPQDALLAGDVDYLQIENFDQARVLEHKLANLM